MLDVVSHTAQLQGTGPGAPSTDFRVHGAGPQSDDRGTVLRLRLKQLRLQELSRAIARRPERGYGTNMVETFRRTGVIQGAVTTQPLTSPARARILLTGEPYGERAETLPERVCRRTQALHVRRSRHSRMVPSTSGHTSTTLGKPGSASHWTSSAERPTVSPRPLARSQQPTVRPYAEWGPLWSVA